MDLRKADHGIHARPRFGTISRKHKTKKRGVEASSEEGIFGSGPNIAPFTTTPCSRRSGGRRERRKKSVRHWQIGGAAVRRVTSGVECGDNTDRGEKRVPNKKKNSAPWEQNPTIRGRTFVTAAKSPIGGLMKKRG